MLCLLDAINVQGQTADLQLPERQFLVDLFASLADINGFLEDIRWLKLSAHINVSPLEFDDVPGLSPR